MELNFKNIQEFFFCLVNIIYYCTCHSGRHFFFLDYKVVSISFFFFRVMDFQEGSTFKSPSRPVNATRHQDLYKSRSPHWKATYRKVCCKTIQYFFYTIFLWFCLPCIESAHLLFILSFVANYSL